MTQKELKQILRYDPETGVFSWATPRKKIIVGSVAGSIANTGYVVIKISQVAYLAHRLAWLWVHGELPAVHIDHINCIRNDNRIDNLRLCTVSQNHQNTLLSKANSSGVKGVSWSKKDRRWRARIKLMGRELFLGNFTSIERAEEAVRQAREKIHAGYYNHGQPDGSPS